MGWHQSDQPSFKSEPPGGPPCSSSASRVDVVELQFNSNNRRFSGATPGNNPIHSSNKSDHRWDPTMTSYTSHSSQSPPAPSTFLHSSLNPLHEVLAPPPSIMDSSSHSSPLHLTAPSSVGASSTKVAKKRSRASRRPPTTILEADSSNFRSMVQQLTGIPAPTPQQMQLIGFHSRFSDQFLGGSGLVRPQASRPFSFTSSLESSFFPNAGAGSFLQYQPPYSLRKLESQQQYRSDQIHEGLRPDSSRGALKNSPALGDGVYVSQSGDSNAWECENESLNARVKREDGRPLASSSTWSTRL